MAASPFLYRVSPRTKSKTLRGLPPCGGKEKGAAEAAPKEMTEDPGSAYQETVFRYFRLWGICSRTVGDSSSMK
jgi:hypothetical protein